MPGPTFFGQGPVDELRLRYGAVILDADVRACAEGQMQRASLGAGDRFGCGSFTSWRRAWITGPCPMELIGLRLQRNCRPGRPLFDLSARDHRSSKTARGRRLAVAVIAPAEHRSGGTYLTAVLITGTDLLKSADWRRRLTRSVLAPADQPLIRWHETGMIIASAHER